MRNDLNFQIKTIFLICIYANINYLKKNVILVFSHRNLIVEHVKIEINKEIDYGSRWV